MSAAGRTTARRAQDYYRTPRWAVHRLLDAIHEDGQEQHLGGVEVFDPCAGDGQLRKAFDTWDGPLPDVEWIENDIRPDATAEYDFDYLDPSGALWSRFDMTIMNPPYNQAQAFVEKAIEHSRVVYALLRLSWLASATRREFISAYPPDVFVLPNRPSFDGKGTDYRYAAGRDPYEEIDR